MEIMRSAYHAVVVEPLRQLYRNGPRPLFWGARSTADVCYEMTNFDAKFWDAHVGDCTDMIDERFASFLATVECVLYFICLYKLMTTGIAECVYCWVERVCPTLTASVCCWRERAYRKRRMERVTDVEDLVLLYLESNAHRQSAARRSTKQLPSPRRTSCQ